MAIFFPGETSSVRQDSYLAFSPLFALLFYATILGLRQGRVDAKGLFTDVIASLIIAAFVADLAADLVLHYVFDTFPQPTFSQSDGLIQLSWLWAILLPFSVFLGVFALVWIVDPPQDKNGSIRERLKKIARQPVVLQIGEVYSSLITVGSIVYFVISAYDTGMFRIDTKTIAETFARLNGRGGLCQMAISPNKATCVGCETNLTGSAKYDTGMIDACLAKHGEAGVDSCFHHEFDIFYDLDKFLTPSLILDYLLRFIAADNWKAHFFDSCVLADFFSISEFPAYLLGMKRAWVQSFGFLKFLRLYRTFNLDMVKDRMEPVKHKVVLLLLVVICMFIIFAGVTQAIEFGKEESDGMFDCFHDCVYFAVVTLTTVGFGDMAPKTMVGRIVMMLMMIAGVALFSMEISQLVELMGEYPQFSGKYYPRRDRTHVILGGNLTDESCRSFLSEFFHSNHHEDGTESACIVILCPQEPSAAMRKFFLNKNIKFLEGSTTNAEDLDRASIETADGIFILSNKMSLEPEEEDTQAILSAIAVEKRRKDIPTYVQVIQHESVELAKAAGADVVVCSNDFRDSLMAGSFHCQGVTTLFSNLVRSTDYDGSDYADGCGWEVYVVPFSSDYVGHNFTSAVLHTHGLGLFPEEDEKKEQTKKQQHEDHELKHPPGEQGSQRKKEKGRDKTGGMVKGPLHMMLLGVVSEKVKKPKWSETYERYENDKAIVLPNTKPNRKAKDGKRERSGSKPPEITKEMALHQCKTLDCFETRMNPGGDYVIQNTDMAIIMATDNSAASLVSSWSGFIPSANSPKVQASTMSGPSSELVHPAGLSAAEDYGGKNMISTEADAASDAMYESCIMTTADDTRDHVVICGRWCGTVVAEFLNSDQTRCSKAGRLGGKNPAGKVVFLHPELPSRHDWQELEEKVGREQLQRVVMVQGSPFHVGDLTRVATGHARMVLILANPSEVQATISDGEDANSDGLIDDATDGSTIKIALTIKAVLAKRSLSGGLDEQDVFVVHELLKPQHIPFLDFTDWWSKHPGDIELAPVFRTGSIFYPGMLDTLLCQAFYCAHAGSIMNNLLAQCTQIHIATLEADLGLTLVGKPYGDVWDILVKQEAMLPVAVLSSEIVDQESESVDRSELSFVENLRNLLNERRKDVQHKLNDAKNKAVHSTKSINSTRRVNKVSPNTASKTETANDSDVEPNTPVVAPEEAEAGLDENSSCLITNPRQDRVLKEHDEFIMLPFQQQSLPSANDVAIYKRPIPQ